MRESQQTKGWYRKADFLFIFCAWVLLSCFNICPVLWFHRDQKALTDTSPCTSRTCWDTPCPQQNRECYKVNPQIWQGEERTQNKKRDNSDGKISWGHSTALICSWSHALSTAGSSGWSRLTQTSPSFIYLEMKGTAGRGLTYSQELRSK